jgi:uncharacterized protein (TIGR03086 family)
MTLLTAVAGGEPGVLVDGPLAARVSGSAQEALEAWRRRGLAGSVAVGRSLYPAALALEIVPLELVVHGWDIAHATGAQLELPTGVVEHVLGQARELITPDKRGKSFGPELTTPDGAPALDRLIAFTGRTPLLR